MPLPTLRLDHPDYYSAPAGPVETYERRVSKTWREHSVDMALRMGVIFGTTDVVGLLDPRISIAACQALALAHDQVLVGFTPNCFLWLPVTGENMTALPGFRMVEMDEVEFADLDWFDQLDIMGCCHIYCCYWLLRLRTEVIILGGKTTRGYPAGRHHNQGS